MEERKVRTRSELRHIASAVEQFKEYRKLERSNVKPCGQPGAPKWQENIVSLEYETLESNIIRPIYDEIMQKLNDQTMPPSEPQKNARPRVYMDIAVEGEQRGRIIYELYDDIVPITAENFRALCTGEKVRSVFYIYPLCYSYLCLLPRV